MLRKKLERDLLQYILLEDESIIRGYQVVGAIWFKNGK